MRLTPPKQITFWVSILLGILGLIFYLVSGIGLVDIAFWFPLAGLVLLILALFFKGL